MVQTYRNRQRNGRHLGDVVSGLVWLFGGLVVVAVAEGFVGDSVLLLVISAPLLVLWMAPLSADFFGATTRFGLVTRARASSGAP
jgi:hypothetical protein